MEQRTTYIDELFFALALILYDGFIFLLWCGFWFLFGSFILYAIVKYVLFRLPNHADRYHGLDIGIRLTVTIIVLIVCEQPSYARLFGAIPNESFPWFPVISALALVFLTAVASFFVHIPASSPPVVAPSACPSPSRRSDIFTCARCQKDTPLDEETRYCMHCGAVLPATGATIALERTR